MEITYPKTVFDEEQIHRLNYKTFAAEIPQHETNPDGLLVDKFHAANNYLLAKRDDKLIGMLCYRLDRPFSLDSKLADLDSLLPAHNKLAEVRLFCVEPEERKSGIGTSLMKALCKELIPQGVDAAIISGTTRQTRLYLSVGFIPFGPLVGKSDALYQPMFIHIKNLRNDLINY
jgi:ribosomal protein S18 acetylase RimI-like enzyme